MTRPLLRVVLGLLIFAEVAILPARAGEGEGKGPYVVLVGVGDWADKQVPARPHAEDDAKVLYDLFTSKDYLGAGQAHTRLLLGKPDEARHSQPATRANILKALHWIVAEARPDDLVIFAYFGQAAMTGDLGDRVCYFASDSTFANRGENAVAAADIARELDHLKSQKFAAFLDVSFQAVGGRDVFSDANPDSEPYREFLGWDREDPGAYVPGRTVFLASIGRTASLDLKDHGLFATVLLDGLKGKADREGDEPDGVVTAGELTAYLEEQLPPLARKNGKTREEKEQFAWALGSRTGRFGLTRNPAVAPGVQERLAKLRKLVAEQKLPEQVGAEGERWLAQMPKLRWQRSLRKEYQQLAEGSLTVEKFSENRERILADAKLDRADALSYAGKVTNGVKVIHDSYVREVNLGDMVAWSVRGLYRWVDESVPPQLAERLAGARELREAELTELLADARAYLGKREDLDKHKDLDLSLQQMARHLDRFTLYFGSDTVDNRRTEVMRNFTGIGVQINKDSDRELLRVMTPYKGSPAYKAGIVEGDLITKITRETDGEGKKLDKPEVVPGKGLSLNDAVKNLSGRPGTRVKVTVERDGRETEFEVARAQVEMETVLGVTRKSDDEWDYWIDPAEKLAYVRLTNFGRGTYRDLLKATKELGADRGEVKGLVLDLRFNVGGLLDVAVNIADLFIDDGSIVTIRPRVGRENNLTGKTEGSLLSFPMVCLVNRGSMSASELVAACLQDHRRAVILGERSYGKGSVQNLLPFEGGQIQLTRATYWRPSGKNVNRLSTSGKETDEWGVTPDKDFTVKLTFKEHEALLERMRDAEIIHRRGRTPEVKDPFKDKQLERAVEYLRGRGNAALREQALALNDVTGEERIRARIHALAEDADDTIKLLAVAAGMAREKDPPLNINAALILAETARKVKQLDAGEALYRLYLGQALKLQSGSKVFQAYNGLVELYDDNKKYAESAKLSRELLETEGNEGAARMITTLLDNLVRSLARQQKYDEAHKVVDRFLSARPDNWFLLSLKGWVQRESGDPEKSARTYETALDKIRGEDPKKENNREPAKQIRYTLSGLYVDLNRIDKAAEHLKALLADEPNNPQYNNDLGYIWADHDTNLPEAEKLIRKAIDEDRRQKLAGKPGLKPEDVKANGSYLDSLGWVLYKQKNYAEARKYLLQAVQDLASRQAEFYAHLADVHTALGEKAEAVAAWKTGIAIAGSNQRAQKVKVGMEKKLKAAE
jgi:C-terminal peptidase prc